MEDKWVYKINRDIDGHVAQFKIRLVMNRYFQQFGVDFDQIFVSVIKPIAFYIHFVVVEFFDLNIDQMDVRTTFLYGLIDQLIYVKISKRSKTKAN